MGVLDGNPKHEPLHYGEVFTIWEASMGAKGCLSCTTAYTYHVGDEDLKSLLGELIGQLKKEIKELDHLLLDNGIPPAPMPPERPEAKLEDIPAGARFTDMEVAAKIAMENSAGLVACSTAMGLSIREDVGALFAKYHGIKTGFGLKILKMVKEKGWLVPPPLLIKKPE
jgi:hypothetical protein